MFEYTGDPSCIFRISWGRAPRTVVLSGVTVVAEGDPLVELHLWNDRMEGRTAGLSLVRDLRRSLQELASYLERADPQARLRVVHGVAGMVGGADVERLAGILRRLGFEVGPPSPAAHRPWRASFWEGFFARWLLLAYNPRAYRRQRTSEPARFDIWLDRDVLDEWYGPKIDRRQR